MFNILHVTRSSNFRYFSFFLFFSPFHYFSLRSFNFVSPSLSGFRDLSIGRGILKFFHGSSPRFPRSPIPSTFLLLFFFPPFFPTPVLWFPRSMRKLDVETTLLGGIKFVEKETGEKTIEKNKKSRHFHFLRSFEMDN